MRKIRIELFVLSANRFENECTMIFSLSSLSLFPEWNQFNRRTDSFYLRAYNIPRFCYNSIKRLYPFLYPLHSITTSSWICSGNLVTPTHGVRMHEIENFRVEKRTRIALPSSLRPPKTRRHRVGSDTRRLFVAGISKAGGREKEKRGKKKGRRRASETRSRPICLILFLYSASSFFHVARRHFPLSPLSSRG